MLRLASYDIVFQEVPDEVTLALNISNCPNNCKGCHSTHLQKNIGEILDESLLESLIKKYERAITCICFMGGDISPETVEKLAKHIKSILNNKIKTAWYSGKSDIPENIVIDNFNYIKLGPYLEEHGALNVPTSNQRFYKIDKGKLIDITQKFYHNN